MMNAAERTRVSGARSGRRAARDARRQRGLDESLSGAVALLSASTVQYLYSILVICSVITLLICSFAGGTLRVRLPVGAPRGRRAVRGHQRDRALSRRPTRHFAYASLLASENKWP